MADSVTVVKIKEVGTKVTYAFTNHSDGTGESLVTKVTASALVGHQSNAVLHISKVKFCVSGVASVKLLFDGTPDKEALVLSGNGELDLSGNLAAVLPNTASTPTGNILLSTVGFVANSSYTIIAEFTKVGFNL